MKVGIIGAGIAGLCTGIYARQNGYDTHIFEMHSQPGGLCTAWKRNGYTVDCCIHWFTGSRPGTSLYKVWDEIGLVKQLRFIDLDEFARVEFADAPPITLYTDVNRLLEHLVAYAPEDEKAIREFLGAAKSFARGPELPSDLPPRELMSLGTMLKLTPTLLRLMPKLHKWNALTIAEFVTRFKNPHVRRALGEIWLPEMSAFTLVATLAWFHDKQAGYPLGGSLPIAEAAAKRYTDLGGDIDYRTRVAQIIVENDRAVGVRLADGREERCDYVVSAADAHATIFDMLAGKYVDDVVNGWFRDYQPFPALVFVGIGVDRDFADQPKLVSGLSLPLEAPITIGNVTVDRFGCRLSNYDPSLAPAGKTTITCMLPGDYEYWTALVKDRSRYDAEKKAVGEALVDALDKRFPGLREQVEMIDVATPHTWERYTGNWRASFEGWLPTPKNMTAQMRKTLPGLGRFYMAGQWVAPGGGLPSGVMTGRAVVQLICHNDGKAFRPTTG